MSTCVIVAGTYRSGTSLLARFLHESGVDMNPAASSKDVPGWHPTGSYKDSVLECGIFQGWPDYFACRNTDNIWGVKAHAMLFSPGMLDGFIASCPAHRKVLIWTTRDQLSAARSWKALRQDLSLETAINRISDQVSRLNAIYDNWQQSDRLLIEFPATAINPQSQLESVAHLIGIPFLMEACAHIQADIPQWK